MLATDNPPEECSAMSASVTSDEIKNELKTTLTARHGLGPEYDDAFIDSFMDKLGTKVVRELQQRHELRPAPPPARPAWALTVEERLTIALVSMLVIMAFFFMALMSDSPYGDHAFRDWSVFCAIAVFLVNLALNVRLHLKIKR